MSEEGEFWMLVRQALLLLVDAVERYKLKLATRTAELRKDTKQIPDRS